MFVHDFVSVDQPAIDVVDRFLRLQPMLGSLVLAAWAADRETWPCHEIHADFAPTWPLHTSIGQPRVRPDAVVIPLHWHSGDESHRVSLDADLEITPVAANVTHLHLMGQYALPPTIERWSQEASRGHRATVSAMRRFLQLMSEQFVAAAPTSVPEEVIRSLEEGAC